MARWDHPIHSFLAGLTALDDGARVLDLGCGAGGTLAAIARRAPKAKLCGLDLNAWAIAEARQRLAPFACELELVQADLGLPLSLEPARFDLVVCHNVLECLPDPEALLREAARVMKPGGLAIWSHVDFDSIATTGADVALDRRVVHAYADATPAWTSHADGRIGRKLATLLRSSPLVLEELRAWGHPTTEWTPEADARIADVVATLSDLAKGSGPVTAAELEAWQAQLRTGAGEGRFFFSETTYVATARLP